MYVGTRPDNVGEACEIIGRELAKLHAEGVSADELERAKEHVKGRMVLGLESSGARMARLARGILFDVPVLSLDEMLERVDAVSAEQVAELAAELYDPERLAAACVGRDEELFRSAAGQGQRSPAELMIRVVVSGAAGRMGEAACEAVAGAEDLELAARADPALDSAPGARRSATPTWSVDFSTPDVALDNIRACLDAGVHAVVGTTGFDLDELRAARRRARARRAARRTSSSRPTSRSAPC